MYLLVDYRENRVAGGYAEGRAYLLLLEVKATRVKKFYKYQGKMRKFVSPVRNRDEESKNDRNTNLNLFRKLRKEIAPDFDCANARHAYANIGSPCFPPIPLYYSTNSTQ